MSVIDRWHKTFPKLDHLDPEKNDKPCKCGTTKRPLYPTAAHPRPAEGGRRAVKGGMRWQVMWVDLEGKTQKKNFRLREGKNITLHADAYDAHITAELNKGTYIDPKAGEITLAEYAAQWRSYQPTNKPNTTEGRDGRLAYIYDVARPEGAPKSRRKGADKSSPIGERSMTFLSRKPSVIQAWIKWLTDDVGLVNEYASQICGTLSSIFKAAIDDGIVGRNPLESPSVKWPPPSEKPPVVPWTLEQVEAAADWIGEHFDRHETMVYLGSGAGLRQGEIFAFAEEDIVFLKRFIHVRRAVKIVQNTLVFGLPKRGKVRTVPLSEPLEFQLAAQLKKFPAVEVTLPWERPDGPPHTAKLLFPRYERLAWSRMEFNREVWWPAREAAGMAPGRANGMHALRHTFVSACLANGVSIGDVSEYLGHEDAGFTLNFYRHLMPGSADHVRAALGAFFRPKASGPTALEMPSG